eukprot:CAMPEP_0181201722 /NCGR_PEP_ID=MMETSP1096-20121128/18456_1 /TAXON_ID=156174 ORGANISM="Chrysochromulina ericina, Strain CCMP281" /NCGR_SAMPLE_ID=MMETSP1096 /ASSEMBLY_ACC=CAM_ASM_000453 /LENGTH=187 /DNA_ID=CAMNT_0023292179 /DNA_START=168 /DNA_END=732 /DNA_ORIENTATION=+
MRSLPRFEALPDAYGPRSFNARCETAQRRETQAHCTDLKRDSATCTQVTGSDAYHVRGKWRGPVDENACMCRHCNQQEDASAQALTKCMVKHCKATLPGCYPKPHKHHDSAGAGQSGPDGRIGVNRGVIASSAGRSTWKEGDRWKLTSCACSGPGKSRNRFILCHLSLFLGIIPSTARLNGSTGFFL